MSTSTPSSPRIDAAISTFLGEPTDALEQAIDDETRHALSEGQQKRLDAGMNQRICVYPEREGFYRVHSVDVENDEPTEYTVDWKYESAKTCTCGDFMFRLDAQAGQMCKHMWRTTLLMRLGSLPKSDRDPYDWLLDELMRDVRLLEGMAESERDDAVAASARRMRTLLDEVRDTHRITVDYPRICSKRAEILKAAKSA